MCSLKPQPSAGKKLRRLWKDGLPAGQQPGTLRERAQVALQRDRGENGRGT
jgi:hypothetical protein